MWRFPEPRRLLIVSHVVHYRHDGQLFAYGPYAREIDIWADLFESVVIAAPLRHEPPLADSVAFSRVNVSVRAQREAGGDTFAAKVKLFAAIPVWAVGLMRAMRHADAIHVRCPGNLGLVGAALAPMFSRRLVAKYAGQWNGYVGEPTATRLQRRILGSSWWRGPVTVYGQWPNQPSQIVSFFTSMMTAAQVEHAVEVASTKRLGRPLRILFSGTLQPRKRVDALIDAVQLLADEGVAIELAIVGDGLERKALQQRAGDLERHGIIRFIGGLPYEDSLRWFEWAHCLVLPSRHSEGWPKVITEAMCYGVVCIGVSHGQVPAMLVGRGILLPTGSAGEIAAAIRGVVLAPEQYQVMMRAASEWARQFSLDGLRAALFELLAARWKLPAADQVKPPKKPITAGRQKRW